MRFTIGFIFILLVSIFSCKNVNAEPIITPPALILFYGTELNGTYSFGLGNTGNENLKLDVYADGELKEYINLYVTNVSLGPKEWKSVVFDLNIPVNLSPGPHVTYIKSKEHIEESDSGGIVAISEIAFTIEVKVPYPGNYLEIVLNTQDSVQAGSNIKVNLDFRNLGTNDLNNVETKVEFLDIGNNKSMGVLNFEKFNIKTTNTHHLSESYSTKGWGLGNYNAKGTIKYAGETKEVSKPFNVGDIKMDILGLNSTRYASGSINKIGIIVSSKWNRIINNVYVQIELTLKDGRKVEAKSQNIDIGSWGVAEIPVFLDMTDLEPGTYKLSTKLFYFDKTAERDFDIEVYRVWYKGLLKVEFLLVLIILILLALFVRNYLRTKKITTKKK